MINPLFLRTYCTLVELRHFTRTAERLHMTQSGVSQHVQKLEEQLGTALLVRQGKQFTLTDAGERLYAGGRDLLADLSGLERQVGVDPPFEGLVRIMSPGSVGLKLYPQLLDLQRRYPKLVLDYRFAPNADVEKAVASGKVDIGLMSSSSTLPAVSCRAVATEALLLVTPAGSGVPTWELLLELGFIDHPDGAHHANLLLSANYPEFQSSSQFAKAGFSNQISLILEPVALGLGFTVLPAHAVAAFPRHDLVEAHPLKAPVSETLHLAVQHKRYLPSRVETVINEAEECL